MFDERKIGVYMKRDDLVHPEIMGNKWRKLKFNIEKAKDAGKDTLVSYGGAFSNHIAALASAGRIFGLKTVGIIRGDELNKHSNPTLQKACEDSMKLVFVSRQDFRFYKEKLSAPFEITDNMMALPEGGTNENAINGCREMMTEQDTSGFDVVCVPTGTGGTFTGIACELKENQHLWGFSALKGKWIEKELSKMLDHYNVTKLHYLVIQDHFFGGYGKFNRELIQFILDFKQLFGILLDPIYTGKMIFNVWNMVKSGQIETGTDILLIHTGGIQGIEGFNFLHGTDLPTI